MAKAKAIEIIFEDEHLIAVNKPSGMLTIPDRYDPQKANVKSLLLKKHKTIYTIHRLDRYTSGLILFAKTAAAHQQMNEQFSHRQVEKKYWALVKGVPDQKFGTIKENIGPDVNRSGKMKVSGKGKTAVSHYEVLKSFQGVSLLEVNIETGRTHQIRVHCKFMGHPLLVDSDYGGAAGWYLSSIKGRKYRGLRGRHNSESEGIKKAKGKKDEIAKPKPSEAVGKTNTGRYDLDAFDRGKPEEKPLLGRPSLHSRKLSFKHPITKEQLALEAELPKDMRATIKQLERWS